MKGDEGPPKTLRRRRRVGAVAEVPAPVESPFDGDLWARDLREALDRVALKFSAIPDTVMNRRRRTAQSLNALNRGLSRHPALKTAECHQYFALLSMALDGLNLGRQHEIVTPTEGLGSGAPDTPAEQRFRVFVLVGVALLTAAKVSPAAACKFMSVRLTEAGYRGEKTPTHFPASTIMNWRASLYRKPDHADAKLVEQQFLAFARNADHWPPSQEQAQSWATSIATHPATFMLKRPKLLTR